MGIQIYTNVQMFIYEWKSAIEQTMYSKLMDYKYRQMYTCTWHYALLHAIVIIIFLNFKLKLMSSCYIDKNASHGDVESGSLTCRLLFASGGIVKSPWSRLSGQPNLNWVWG